MIDWIVKKVYVYCIILRLVLNKRYVMKKYLLENILIKSNCIVISFVNRILFCLFVIWFIWNWFNLLFILINYWFIEEIYIDFVLLNFKSI